MCWLADCELKMRKNINVDKEKKFFVDRVGIDNDFASVESKLG